MRGSILQINVSAGGVPKRAIPQGLVTELGLEGDLHANPDVHGGPSKALLLITSEGIAELVNAGFPLFHGALGENLTTAGLDRKQMRPGQRYRAGEIEIELVKIRVPCKTIKVYGSRIGRAIYDDRIKAGDPSSPRWGLSGFYARVIAPGVIRAGDTIELTRA